MLRLLMLALTLAASASAAPACGPYSPCAVETGHYLVRTPAGWDGKSALPVAVYFHGWRGQAAAMMADANAERVFTELGVLLVAPQGLDDTWELPPFNRGRRDEFAFVAAVMADVARRFPIDRSRQMATGFSQGGSFVWYLACDAAVRFTAYVPFAGSFWQPIPASCSRGPVNLLHIHGVADPMVPIKGRRVGGGYVQGDVFQGLAILRKTNACNSPHVEENRQLAGGTPVACQLDKTCASGRRLEACFHAGEHLVDSTWYESAWAFTGATMAKP